MSLTPRVVVVHTENGLRDEARRDILDQWPLVDWALTPTLNPFAYGDVLRRLWPHSGELVIIEQDVIPPQGGIADLLACARDWCTFPHWTGERYTTDTFGCVKLGWILRLSFPMLPHVLYAKPDPRYFVRRGWTKFACDVSPQMLNSRLGRRATLRDDLAFGTWPENWTRRPTTHDWLGLDTTLFSQLKAWKIEPHVHDGVTTHLHDYEANPVGARLPWHQRPYDPREWPR